MSNTPSNMLPLGTTAPEVNLIDTVFGKIISLNDIKGETATVIMFICNHCPFVIHVNEQLIVLANDYKNSGVGFAAISSNDVENYPQDSPELMKSSRRNYLIRSHIYMMKHKKLLKHTMLLAPRTFTFLIVI